MNIDNLDAATKTNLLNLVIRLSNDFVLHEPAASIAKRAIEEGEDKLTDHEREILNVTKPILEKYYYSN